MKRLRPIPTLVCLLLLAASPARSGDGVLEINLACATSTGCFAGDPPGFPVTIATPGSYRLTGNLPVPDGNTTAIEITSSNVAVDLGGFSVGCFPAVCAPGTGIGIDASTGPLFPPISVSVRNGTVSGMGSDGIRLEDGGLVEDVLAIGNSGTGIFLVFHGVVRRSRALQNDDHGIFLSGGLAVDNIASLNGWTGIQGGAVVAGNTCNDNGIAGIDTGYSSISGNTVMGNQSHVIDAGSGSRVEGNVVSGNGGYGIKSLENSLVSSNAVTDNTLHGIYAEISGSAVIGNMAGKNGGDGIRIRERGVLIGNASFQNSNGIHAGGTSLAHSNTVSGNSSVGLEFQPGVGGAFRENLVRGNGSTTVNGQDMGGNNCDGSTTCP